MAGDHRYQLVVWMLGSDHRPDVPSGHGRIQEGRSQNLVTIEQDTLPEPTIQTNKMKVVIKKMSPVAVFIIISVYLSLRQDRQTSTLLYNSTQYHLPCLPLYQRCYGRRLKMALIIYCDLI